MSVTDTVKKTNPVIYVIDPDQNLRSALITLFKRTGYEAVSYPDAEEFLETEQQFAPYGCIVSEMKLPGIDGLGFLTALRDRNCRLPVIILTGDPDVAHAVTALHNKASDYLVKPVIERELINRIKLALRRSREVQGLTKNE